MRKIIWITGLIAGLLISSNFFYGDAIAEALGVSAQTIGFGMMTLLMGLGFYWAVGRIDKEQYHGHINFSQAFVASFYILLIVSLVYTLMWELYFSLHGQEFVENYLQDLKQGMQEEGLGADKLEERLNNQRQVMDAYQEQFMVRFGLTMAEIFPLGILLALLNALFQSLRARRRESNV